jgi:hypothetical protein
MLVVLYYSNDILSKSLPELGPYISLAITVVNVIMTFPTVFLIEVFPLLQRIIVSTHVIDFHSAPVVEGFFSYQHSAPSFP